MRAALAAVLAAVLVGLFGPTARAEQADDTPVVPEGRRVLVLAIPGLTWQDVNEADMPALRQLLDGSAVASLSMRIVRMATQPGEGYATIGAGTRAVASSTLAGMVYAPDEAFGPGTAAEEVARQRGRPVDGDVLSVAWRQLAAQNRRSDFEADLGALGDALEAAGIGRGVIANADGDDPLAAQAGPHREAGLALASSDGAVPCGDVSPRILAVDPTAPFALRLDPNVVLQEFRRCSTPGSVVLVEASDLRRTDAFIRRLSGDRADEVRAEALHDTDRLVERLVGELDLDRDAVVVVSPSVARHPRLGVLGIHAAEYPPRLLVSGSTRQDGYVTIADVAPTIAGLAGAPIDEGALEGRRVSVGRTGGSAADRRLGLEDDDAVARFRDRMITPVAGTYISGVCLLALGAVAVLARRRRSRVLELLALVLLAVTPVTYLARAFPFHEWGTVAYAAFLVAASAVLGFVYSRVGGSWLRPLAAAYAVVIGVIVFNVAVVHSHLQLGSVFGDSAIVAGRFNGVNNVMFAQLIVAATALAAITAHVLRGRRAAAVLAIVLGGVAFVIAAPMWGADVGGTLAGIPTLAVVGARLRGWKVRWRTVALWLLAAVGAVIVFGLIDLTRDSAHQSHLARLFERIHSEGIDGFNTVVGRKLATNLRSVQGSVWRFILGPVIIASLITVWRAPGRFRSLATTVPAVAAVVPGLLLGFVLGYALNDSGIAVPGMMLAVSVPAVVYLLSRSQADDVSPAPAPAPTGRTTP